MYDLLQTFAVANCRTTLLVHAPSRMVVMETSRRQTRISARDRAYSIHGNTSDYFRDSGAANRQTDFATSRSPSGRPRQSVSRVTPAPNEMS
jgi:hypothetical protein